MNVYQSDRLRRTEQEVSSTTILNHVNTKAMIRKLRAKKLGDLRRHEVVRREGRMNSVEP